MRRGWGRQAAPTFREDGVDKLRPEFRVCSPPPALPNISEKYFRDCRPTSYSNIHQEEVSQTSISNFILGTALRGSGKFGLGCFVSTEV